MRPSDSLRLNFNTLRTRGAKNGVSEKTLYFNGLCPFEADFYVPANCCLPLRSNETPEKSSKASELSIVTTDHEEANLVCFVNFVNPNFGGKWP